MTKILFLILSILLAIATPIVFAETLYENDGTSSSTTQAGINNSTNTATASSPNTIYTSEIVPGAKCQCVTGAGTSESLGTANVACTGDVTARKYKCTVPTGLAGFQSVFAQIIRFVINIVLLLGVLAVVGLGIAWSFAGGDDIKAKSSLKKWAINILIGLAILFFFRYILLFLAPWVYQ